MKLGDMLIINGTITQVQLEAALQEQKNKPGERIGEILVRMGFATDEEILKACIECG